MISLIICIIVGLQTVHVQGLKCRTREHMQQQQDFYTLASNCMKSSLNFTQLEENDNSSWDYRRPHRPGNNDDRNYANNRPDNRPDNRHNGRNKDDNSGNSNTCDHHHSQYSHHSERHYGDRNQDYYPTNQRNPIRDGPQFDNENDRQRSITYRQKRSTGSVQKYQKKNGTASNSKFKSPLEDIGACVIHCIFKEMKMLNENSKPDRSSMLNVMTRRIKNDELKEFIQDSIEECFDIMDTNMREDDCELSKKIILCLEEKAKRSCEDWEQSDNSTHVNPNFNLNKNEEKERESANINNSNNRYPNFNKAQKWPTV